VNRNGITIEASLGAVLDGQGLAGETGIHVMPFPKGASIKGFRLRGPTFTGNSVLTEHGRDFVVSAGTYLGNREYGIFALHCADGRIENNRVSGGRRHRDLRRAVRDITVRDSVAQDSTVGIEVENSTGVTVASNRAATVKDGKFVSGGGTWTYSSGMGKFKNIKGPGTYKGTPNADGTVSYAVAGTYSLKESAGRSEHVLQDTTRRSEMNRAERFVSVIVAIGLVGMLAAGNAASAAPKDKGVAKEKGMAKAKGKHEHRNGKQLLGEKIKTNGHHVLDKKGDYTTSVEVQNGKVAGVHVKHAKKGDIPVKKYKTNKKMAGRQIAVPAGGFQLASMQYQDLGTVWIGYAYTDEYGEEVIYWFPYDMVLDGDTGAVDYIPE
jgi:hypothetical protein